MDAPSTPHASANAEAITLMSTDAADLSSIGSIAVESVAYTVEVLVGFVLLAREVGWIWPLPLVLIIGTPPSPPGEWTCLTRASLHPHNPPSHPPPPCPPTRLERRNPTPPRDHHRLAHVH